MAAAKEAKDKEPQAKKGERVSFRYSSLGSVRTSTGKVIDELDDDMMLVAIDPQFDEGRHLVAAVAASALEVVRPEKGTTKAEIAEAEKAAAKAEKGDAAKTTDADDHHKRTAAAHHTTHHGGSHHK